MSATDPSQLTSRLSRFAIAGRRAGLRTSLSASAVGVIPLAAGLVLSRRALDSYDAQIMFAVAKSLATTHTTYVPRAADAFDLNTPHSSYGLGQSLLEAPAILLAMHTGLRPEALAMLVNPVLFAAVSLAIWAWARAAAASEAQAAAVALLTSFGTMLLAYTPTGGSELGTALGVAIAIFGVEWTRREPVAGSAIAGAGVSAAVLFRPDSALLVALPVAVAVLVITRKGFPLFLLANVPVAVLTLIYNGSHGAQYQGIPLFQAFSYPVARGVYGLLLSPGRGLLLYVPLVLPALAVVPWAWRRSPVVTGLCLALIAVRIPFYGAWFSWAGGWAWGPRFLVPAMPCLAPLVLEMLRRFAWPRWPIAAAVSLVLALSVSVQVLGATVRADTDSANVTMDWVAHSDQVLFDWHYFPILEHVRELANGENLAAGYGGPPGPG